MPLTRIGSIGINTGIKFSGLTTITTLNTSIDALSIGGPVSIAGTLTYEDVTNIDSVGLVTARNGIVVGSGITLSKDGDVFFTGIATGNGSGLTALNATQLTSGTVPTARLGSGTASSSTFLRGDSTFAAVTSTTINSNADNRIITGSSSANTLQGEANLTFDGSTLQVTDATNGTVRVTFPSSSVNLISGGSGQSLALGTGFAEKLRITSTGNVGVNQSSPTAKLEVVDSAYHQLYVKGSDTVGGIRFGNSSDQNGFIYYDNGPNLLFNVNNSEKVRITSSGDFGLGTTSPAYTNALFGGTQRTLHVSGTAAPIVRIQSSTSGQADLILQAGNSAADAFIANTASNGDLVFSTNNGSSQGTRLRILDDGGICFNSDTAAANALDDYEEGTYTPTDASGAGLSFTINTTASYTKIGRMMYIQFDITWPSTSNSATAGFTMPTGLGMSVSYGTGVIGWTDNGKPLFIHVGGQIYIMDNNNSIGNASQHTLNSEISGKRLIGSVWYTSS